MKLTVLGSGSKGNCYLLETSSGILILECGINIKEIQKALDFDFSNVLGCLVTHEHKDHSKSIEELTKRCVDIYTSKGTAEILNKTYWRIKYIKSEYQIKLGNLIILPFETQHDATEPLGFLIYDVKTQEKLLFATDTYYLKYKFTDVNYLLIECNYSIELLEANMINNKISKTQADRLRQSHMSLENLKECLEENNLNLCRNIVLLHLSDGNSNANQFKQEIEELTNIKTDIADKGLILKLEKIPF